MERKLLQGDSMELEPLQGDSMELELLQGDSMELELLQAVKEGRTDEVQQQLAGLPEERKGTLLKARDEDGYTVVHHAAELNHVDVLKLLIFHGADPSLVGGDARRSTALHLAAERGNLAAVEALLNFKKYKHHAELDQSLEPTVDDILKVDSTLLLGKQDKYGHTPLHSACWAGHLEMVAYLLKQGADVTKTDEKGLNPLRKAIRHGHQDVVMEILRSNNWKDALRLWTSVTTPMKELIIKMPDVAIEVLNKCAKVPIVTSPESDSYWVEFDYEFVDDLHCPDRRSNWHFKGTQKSGHPLSVMAQTGNLKLLKHPLVTSLLKHKWRVAFIPYVINFMMYTTFLIFLTAFALCVPNPRSDTCSAVFNGTFGNVAVNQNVSEERLSAIEGGECGSNGGNPHFIVAGGVIILILACIRLLLELFQLHQMGLEYLKDMANWIEVILFTSAIIFVSVFNTDCLCPRPTQWQFGIVAVFLAWTEFILFVEKLPRVGIYVVMLIHMLWIFLKTVPLAVMLVIAFGLALFMAFFEPGILRTPFSTPARSLLSTISYTTGAFDFDGIFHQVPGGDEESNKIEEIPFPPVSYVLWVIFLVFMPILLNNLLVGLAVDDIKETLQKAEARMIALQIDLALSVEAVLCFWHCHYIVTKEKVFPNRKLTCWEKMEELIWGADFFPSGLEIASVLSTTEQVSQQSYHLKQLKHITMSQDEVCESVEAEEMKHLASEQTRLFVEVQEIKRSIEELKKLISEMLAKQAQERVKT